MTNMTTDKPGTQFGADTAPAKPAAKPKTKKPVRKPAAKSANPEPKGEGSKTYVDGLNSPIVTSANADDDARVFAQGRTAALGGISKDDAPYDQADSNHATWLKGHNSIAG